MKFPSTDDAIPVTLLEDEGTGFSCSYLIGRTVK